MKDYYSLVSTQLFEKFKKSFKLTSDDEKDDERSITESSLHYKQRIDSMFDDRTALSSSNGENYQRQRDQCQHINICKEKPSGVKKSCVTNEVQYQINKMFQEVDVTELKKTPFNKSLKFPVSYLGSIKIQKRVSSLRELQSPLKQLFFNYLREGRTYLHHGSLEITGEGLKVKNYTNKTNWSIEKINPFSNIAVWAAVKFVCKRKDGAVEKKQIMEYAFMPLIADPKSVDKITLYQPLTDEESTLLLQEEELDHNLPLFIVVIKHPDPLKQYHCHGFICPCSNDAIIIAANLYTVLMQAIPKLTDGNHNKVDSRGKCSSESSIIESRKEAMSRSSCARSLKFEDSCSCVTPLRPPRKFKSSRSSDTCSYLSIDESCRKTKSGLSTLNENVISKKTNRKEIVENIFKKFDPPNNISSKGTKSNMSNFIFSAEVQDGDILTKVAIPRSKSFLNASGPFFSRYTKGLDGLGNSSPSNHRKNSVGSPLGLSELFQEFRQEGLYSMNDILDTIIDSDGMSFNDLKPIYKEFVLKLALTLTKDELYQRSKSIMQKQKHKRGQVNRRDSFSIKKSLIPGYAIKNALRRSVSSFKLSKYKQSSFEFTSVIFPSCRNNYSNEHNSETAKESVSLSVHSTVLRRREKKLEKKARKSEENKKKSNRSHKSIYLNEELDHRAAKINYLQHSSSGYFSCSECSYSTDSCSCSSGERCYCSLGRSKNGRRGSKSSYDDNEDDNYSICECDTDSCFESDKCYCNATMKSTSFVRLKKMSNIPDHVSLAELSESSSRIIDNVFEDIEGPTRKPPSITNSKGSVEYLGGEKITHSTKNGKKKSLCSEESNLDTKASSFHERSSNANSSLNSIIDGLDLGYDILESEEKSSVKTDRKVDFFSTRDEFENASIISEKNRRASVDVCSLASTKDALSVKKSAEIAALFCNSSDIIYNTLEPPDDFKETFFNSIYGESNLEESLGYLP